MSKVKKYTSSNGYTGVLYGKSSLSIKDKDGREILHTGFRNINTYDELVECVETFPQFIELLSGKVKYIRDDFLNHPEDDDF